MACASQKAKFRGHTDILTGISFSTDGHRLAVGGLDKQVVLWDANDPKTETTIPLVGHTHHLRLVQYLQDGTLLSIGQNGQIFNWDSAAAMAIAEYQLSDRLAASLAASPDGKRIATGGSDGRLHIFDLIGATSPATVGQ